MFWFPPIRLNRGLGLCKSGLLGHWSAAMGFRQEEWTRAAVRDRVRLKPSRRRELEAQPKKKTETRSTMERFRFSPWSPASIPRTISELRDIDSRDFPLFWCRKRSTAKHCRFFALRDAKTGIKSDGSNPTQERRESSLNTTTTLLYTHYNTTRCL